jgi:hypothetical protein
MQYKHKKYISVDVESTGKTPGKYSMLSLGACVVGDIDNQFYRELKPINDNFDPGAMEIGCLGLDCIKDKGDIYNPKNTNFSPKKVLELLKQEGEEPWKAMDDFRHWAIDVTMGYKPIIAAAPIIFDGMFIAYYFDNFSIYENPFGHSGEDMNSMYRGKQKDINVSMKELNLRPKELPHNALEDAIIQAKEFESVLKGIKQ